MKQQVIWHQNGKFQGWPKGAPHGPAKKSAWGDLSSVKNREKFRKYVSGLHDFSPFVKDFNGLIFWRGFSRKIKKTIIAQLKGTDPIGFLQLMALNKRLTRAQNKKHPFVFSDEVKQIKHRTKEGQKSVVAHTPTPLVEQPTPSISRGIPWSDPPSPEELQSQAKAEQKQKVLSKYY